MISNPQHFKPTTLKRARFYKNIIEKKGGVYGLNVYPRLEGGESLGFFGNIKRAFESSWNKKATPQEKEILAPIFQGEKFLTDKIIKPIAPPVGYVADKQREFLENKYLNDGGSRRFM